MSAQRGEPAQVKSLRWTATEWHTIVRAAARRKVSPSVYQRQLVLQPRFDPFTAERLRRVIVELDGALKDPQTRAERLAKARDVAFALFEDLSVAG